MTRPRLRPAAGTTVPADRPVASVSLVVTALATLLVFLLLAPSAPAGAHSELVGSTPQPGATVGPRTDRLVLVFGEPVDPATAQVVVEDLQGHDAAVGRPVVTGTTVEVPLRLAGAGPHRATYRVVSADGHPVVGEVRFAVRARPTRAGEVEPQGAGDDRTAPPSTGSDPVRTAVLAPPDQTTPPAPSGALVVAGAAGAAVVLLPALTLAVARRRRGRPGHGSEG